MRKLAFLFAAALFVSAPLIAATPTLTYAAAKKKAPSAKAPKAEPKPEPKPVEKPEAKPDPKPEKAEKKEKK